VDTYRVDQVLVTRIASPSLPVVVIPAKE
jgi:hypothetical protein